MSRILGTYHSVSSFCFVVFRPQSLLDILESRVMKRMSINHCEMWDIEPRNGTLDSNAGRNVKRSADVWGNARHFCDGELNFTPEFNYRIREKALRNESLETNNARDCLQSCGYLSKWTSFLPFRVQLRMWDIQPKKMNTPKKEPPFSLWRFFSFTIFIFD